ncbi:MAG: hypothetical protein KF725_12395 [Cyclobacteriaceae bacterium]|nr:hypothetical protein [Cyclobacteriaceae bacterium]UYN86497.1 MAG: hypothetical protein KIT51_16790 [Cyclobacteriaceae bacterium]
MATITPDLESDFTASISGAGRNWPIPMVNKDGVGVTWSQQSFTFHISENSKYVNEEIGALIVCKGKIIFRKKIRFNQSLLQQLYLPNNLTDEYHQLYLFSSSGEMIGERIFLPETSPSVIGFIELPKTVAQRETVPFRVTLQNNLDQPLAGEYAVSILQKRLFPDFHPQNIFKYGDLPRTLEWLENTGDLSAQAINNYLITEHWDRIDWHAITKNIAKPITATFESTLKIEGTVHDRTTGEPPPDSTMLLIFFQKNTKGYETQVINGEFKIPFVNDFWGEDYAFMGLQRKNSILDKEYTITIYSDSVQLVMPWGYSQNNSLSSYGIYSENRRIVKKSYAFHENHESARVNRPGNPNSEFEDEFGGADYEVRLNDFVTFSNMKDLIKEVIPFVKHREKAGESIVRVMFRNNSGTKIYDPNPLYIIDGLMTRDTHYFIALNPVDLAKIKIMNNPNKLSRLGLVGKNGVILVESKKGNLAQALLKSNYSLQVGLSRPIKSPPSFEQSNHVPVLQSTLLWEPFSKASNGADGGHSVFTSDDLGDMIIVLQGISENRNPIFLKRDFTVQFQRK